MKAITHRILTAGVILAMLLGVLPLGTLTVQASASGVVISQVYGGGGNSGATHTHDFVELFNAGTEAVSLNGWSIQYASATGTGNFGANSGQLTELPNVTLEPGQYYLVQEATGNAAIGAPLPTPDLVDGTPINMSGSAGKVALAKSASSLGCNGSIANPCSAAQLALIEDLVGFGNANFFEGAAAPGLSNTTSALRNGNGCVDSDNNSADFTAAAPAPRNTASPVNLCGGAPVDFAPTVASTVPTDGATGVAVDQVIEVTFSEAVTAADGAFTLTCENTTAPDITVGGGPVTYTFTPTASFAFDTTCTVSVLASLVTDQDGTPEPMETDYSFSFTTLREFIPIYEIQGSGAVAAVTGAVITQGVVVGDFEGASPTLRGFYIQDPVGDGDPATSDAIFVFNGNNDSVEVGDLVRVTGTAAEFQDQTQITATSVTALGTGSVAPVDVTFPVPSTTYLEQYEGMLVRLPQTMYVTEHFQLGRFGQVVVSVDDRLQQPTSVFEPGPDADALQDLNNRSKLILDDATNAQNPDPIIFSRNETALSAENTLRGGDTITGAVGVMTYTWAGNSASGNAYRLRPIGALGGTFDFVAANPRPEAAPEVGGQLKVVAMNTLNLFNTWDGRPDNVDNCTFGVGGAPADCRGADDQTEFDRQWPKTVDAILEIGPDVLGVNEIENDGYGPDSAIAFLVQKLNEATAPGTYAYIDADAATGQVNALGTDAIKVGLIYKPGTVTPVGATAALNTPEFVNGGDSDPRSRPSLIQAFTENATSSTFIVSVNHLKSKGSACDAPDAGDGQGNCNTVRLNAVNELVAYLATDPTGTGDPDVLIIGDLNSYAKEDPILALEAAGYTNLVSAYLGEDAYSYVFDGQWGYLDYALASPSILDQITGVGEYHINADEPSVLDYNTDFKTAGQIASLYAPDEFRVSDHDPIIVGLAFEQKTGAVEAQGRYIAKKGAYRPNPKVNGKAYFDITAEYETGTNALVGSLDYRMVEAGIHLVSTSFDTLTINTGTAQLGGTGTINGVTPARFLFTLTDGHPDRIRVQIWTQNSGGETLLYDDDRAVTVSPGKITVTP